MKNTSPVLLFVGCLLSVCQQGFAAAEPGLVGGQYGSEDFSRLQSLVRLSRLELKVTDNEGYGNEWSARWFGYVAGPADGEIAFAAEGNQALEMRIAGRTIVAMKPGSGRGSMSMVKGQEYPIEISVVKEGGMQDCHFKIMWSWAGREKVTVPAASLTHTAAQEAEWVRKAEEAEDGNDDEEDEAEQMKISYYDFGLSPSPKVVSGVGEIDLSKAKVVALNQRSKIQASAADMLADEIARRTRIGLEVVRQMPSTKVVGIVIGTNKEIKSKFGGPPSGLAVPQKADGYAIWIDKGKRGAATICLAGHDDRGALYAVGRLLRMMEMGRDKVSVDAGIKIATAPKYTLRGHQMGYRAKTNSYDA
ncbi:MAG: glycoside hydrolase family 20 zincin-like fold domain-containing protein [Planctomycetota bacterium]